MRTPGGTPAGSTRPRRPPTPRTRRCASRSAHEVIAERFASEQARDLLTWLSFATITDVRRAGTGILPFSITAGRSSFGWATPMGGSGALPEALVAAIESQRRAGARGPAGRAGAGAATAGPSASSRRDGERWEARRAVLSSAHITQLAGMLDGAEAPAELRAAAGPGSRGSRCSPSTWPPTRTSPTTPHRSGGRGRRRDRLGGRAVRAAGRLRARRDLRRRPVGAASSARPSSIPTGRRTGRVWSSC